MAESSLVLIAAQGVAASASYLYAALGEAFGQRSGVYNLGVDGIMLMGAFTAFFTVYSGQSPLMGVLLAGLLRAAIGFSMAFGNGTLKTWQGINRNGLY